MDVDQKTSPADHQSIDREQYYKLTCTPAIKAWNEARLATQDNRLDWDKWWDTHKLKYNGEKVNGADGGCLSEATLPR